MKQQDDRNLSDEDIGKIVLAIVLFLFIAIALAGCGFR